MCKRELERGKESGKTQENLFPDDDLSKRRKKGSKKICFVVWRVGSESGENYGYNDKLPLLLRVDKIFK
jgi:hypothetical protein